MIATIQLSLNLGQSQNGVLGIMDPCHSILPTIFLLIGAPSLIVAPPPEKPFNHDNIMNINFYAPASRDRGHTVLLLSVCLSVCPSVCLSAQTLNENLTYFHYS